MRRAVPLLFFFGGSLLLIFGLGALGAAFFLQRSNLPDGFAWRPPLEQVDNRALAPATAMLPLTGMEAVDALSLTLDRAHWENAYALVAYDPGLPDPTRIGALLQLGTRFAAAKDTRKAAWCYQAAARLATLSPAISDSTREDAYLQASAGLRAIGARDAARLIIDQAYLVAQYSPALRQEPRFRRLAQVANAYADLGAGALAAQARAKADQAASASAEAAWVPSRAPFVPAAGKLSLSADVDHAMQARIAAARQLLDDVKKNPPRGAADWSQDLVGQLSDALQQEDRARRAFYEQQLAQVKDPAVQIALLRDKVNWLALKYRTARGAFGVDLVSEWGKNPAEIADASSDAWGNLFRVYESQAAALPNAQDVNQAREDVLKQELLTVRWGWYRGASEKDLHAALGGVTQKLRDASVPALRLDALTRNGKTVDLLVPDELYGQNEQALPR